jgi:hypothetical protein
MEGVRAGDGLKRGMEVFAKVVLRTARGRGQNGNSPKSQPEKQGDKSISSADQDEKPFRLGDIDSPGGKQRQDLRTLRGHGGLLKNFDQDVVSLSDDANIGAGQGAQNAPED